LIFAVNEQVKENNSVIFYPWLWTRCIWSCKTENPSIPGNLIVYAGSWSFIFMGAKTAFNYSLKTSILSCNQNEILLNQDIDLKWLMSSP
jgi:hypothetical protein